MSNKKTASMKPKKSISEDRTPEEYFDEAKAGLLAIANSYMKNVDRPDNVVKEFANIVDIIGNAGFMNLSYRMIENRKAVYKIIKERLDDMTFETLTVDEWRDPFEDLIDYIDTTVIVTNNDEAFEDMMLKFARFDTVRPFGEKVETLRMTLLDKLGK